jgi:hypothetical protein
LVCKKGFGESISYCNRAKAHRTSPAISAAVKWTSLLFRVFANRYERGSLLVTLNLALAQCTTAFGDAALTAAIVHQLTHHGFIDDFRWKSIRFSEGMQRMKRGTWKAPNRVVAVSGQSERAKKVKNPE